MSRPINSRKVAFVPQVTYFKPTGIPLRVLKEVCLSVEEAEAIRLKDMEGLQQEQCAEKMSISRSTFQRVLGSARQKIAEALLNGKAIRIEGGNFKLAVRRFRCIKGHEWEIPFQAMIARAPQFCPTCSTLEILPLQPPGIGRGKKGRSGCSRSRHGM